MDRTIFTQTFYQIELLFLLKMCISPLYPSARLHALLSLSFWPLYSSFGPAEAAEIEFTDML